MDGQCYECHTAVSWQDVAQLEQHRRTRMPLTGKHAIIECNACHKRQGERTFSDLPVDCYGCHARRVPRRDTHPTTTAPTPRATCGRSRARAGCAIARPAGSPAVGQSDSVAAARAAGR